MGVNAGAETGRGKDERCCEAEERIVDAVVLSSARRGVRSLDLNIVNLCRKPTQYGLLYWPVNEVEVVVEPAGTFSSGDLGGKSRAVAIAGLIVSCRLVCYS